MNKRFLITACALSAVALAVAQNWQVPVSEADDASQAFKGFVSKSPRNPMTDKLEGTVFGFGVMFPDCSFHDKISMIELADEQLADADDCISPKTLKAYLLRLAEFWRIAFRDNKKVKLPSAHQSRLITDILRPDFDARISLQSTIRNVENKVLEIGRASCRERV